MTKKISLLHLEDSLKDSELIRAIIESGEILHDYFLTDNEHDFIKILETGNIDLILSDYGLPDYDGNAALKLARERYSNIPFIFVSGKIGEDAAINAMLNGATDYVLKNRLERLVPAIKRAIRESVEEINRKQADRELVIANIELQFQNEEKEKRAAELIIANKELLFQNAEKEKRAAELIVANKELLFQNEEKEKRAAELIIANKELIFQNKEKEKRAAELVAAREKAEESDKLKSAFLNNLSHEIRTPMNHILGFAGILKDPGLDESQRNEYIGIINDSSNQLMRIITDIIEISKITTGQVDMTNSTFNVVEMMSELIAQYQIKAGQRNLRLSIQKGITDREAMVTGDMRKLKKIIGNLVENAIKFTEAGGIDVDYYREGGRLIFKVKDTGIGIDNEEKKVIFEHFRQIEITMARKYSGLGLGLSISNAYIRMMSGTIRVESVTGQGSTFTVEIPYLSANNASRNLHPGSVTRFSVTDWKHKTMLIAEDENMNVLLLKALLSSTGIQLLYAVNGLEAVEQCRNHPEIDVVLMDIKMPRMDGLEATKIIKSFRSDLPVIAVTAFAMQREKEYILKAGFDDYLPKPVIRDALISKIRKNLQG